MGGIGDEGVARAAIPPLGRARCSTNRLRATWFDEYIRRDLWGKIHPISLTYVYYVPCFHVTGISKKNRLFQLFSRYSESSRRWGVRVCDQRVLKEMRCCIEGYGILDASRLYIWYSNKKKVFQINCRYLITVIFFNAYLKRRYVKQKRVVNNFR